MSEKDLGQKVAARRLLWRMGYSTRVDVVLRAAILSNSKNPSPESYTDMDVFGVAITPSGEVQTCVVDCKTGGSSIVSRMFWVRGLVEFFGAHSAYMIRDRAITPDANHLAARLGITALTERNLVKLEEMLVTNVPLTSQPLASLFDERSVESAMKKYTTADKKLKPLLEYRQFGYWVDPDHRSLVALPDTLLAVRKHLDTRNPQHFSLVLDCAWLYLLSLARCIGALRNTHISDLRYGLREYLAGGATMLKQQEEIAELLRALQDSGQIPSGTKVNVDPRFFDDLLELVTRLMRRGTSLNDSLRLLEFQSASAIHGMRQTSASAFGTSFDSTAAKLAADIVRFLVDSGGLSPAFADVASDVLTTVDTPTDQEEPDNVVKSKQAGSSCDAGRAISAASSSVLLPGFEETEGETR